MDEITEHAILEIGSNGIESKKFIYIKLHCKGEVFQING